MNKENDQKMPLLHIYQQKLPHDEVVIVSNRTALLSLKKSIEKALEKGEGDCVVTSSDMETYEIKIILNDEDWQSEFWRSLQLPLFEVDESEEGEVLSVEDIIGFGIKNSEDLRKAQPVMEEYRKHSQEMTEKMKQIAKKNKQMDSQMDYIEIINSNNYKKLDELSKTNNVNSEENVANLLYWAVYMNRVSFVERLLDCGADTNQKDSLGRSLLEIACYFGFYEVCKVLLEKGSRIEENCLQRAQNGWDGNSQSEIIELLQGWHNRQINTEEC